MEINVSGDEPKELQLGKEEEKDVIGLAFEQAEFFSVIMPFLDSKYFQQTAPAMVFTVLEFSYKKYGHLISREMCRDMMMKSLTADDDHKEILGLIDRKLDPRAVPIIMEELSNWAKKRTIGQIYSRETIDAFENGNFEEIEKIIEDAQKITNINNSNHFFFREFQELFVKDSIDRFTTGFKSLDNIMQGGPARGETFCWMAPTGKGKCHTLESKIIIEDLSRIFELEVGNEIVRLAGFREVRTSRGQIRVCDLLEGDDITEIPSFRDEGNVYL